MSSWRRRHPGFIDLSGYVERGEDSADWGQIRLHLRECERCRDEVAWIKRLGEEAELLRDVTPPPGMLEQILARRAAGERAILPVESPLPPPPPRPRRRTRHLVRAGAGLAVLVIAGMFIIEERVEAGANELQFSPRFPEPGDQLTVEYEPTTALAGADSLRLRVRFRAAGQAHEEDEYAGDYLSLTLLADDEGDFEGTFTLPPTAAYAQAVVEDTRGVNVDSNDGRLWEVLTYDERGSVRYEALRQREYMADHADDWRRRRETSSEMTRLFPDRPESWYMRFLHELEYADPANADSLLDVHRDALGQLSMELAGSDVPAHDLSVMMDYAEAVGDENTAEFWATRLARKDPGHYRLLRRGVVRSAMQSSDPASMLEGIEAAWQSSSPRDLVLAQLGLEQSAATARWDLAEVWARRLTEIDPGQAGLAGRRLAGEASTRVAAIGYLREAVSRAEATADRERPLDSDMLEYRRSRSRVLQRVLTWLGEALVSSGETGEAIEVIQRAETLGWDPSLLRQLAEHRAALGDTVAALDLLARAASDPLIGAELEETGQSWTQSAGRPVSAWHEAVAEQRDQLRRWVLEESEFKRLHPDVAVEDRRGSRIPLASIDTGQPTLIAIAAFPPGIESDARMSQLASLHERLSERAFPFVTIVTWSERASFAELVDQYQPGFPIYYDFDNVSGEIFDVSRLMEFVILDAAGTIRGTFRELDPALRLLHLLQRPLAA